MSSLTRRCLLLFSTLIPVAYADAPLHHELRVTLEPTSGRIVACDRITVPPDWLGRPLRFALHGDLQVHTEDIGATLAPKADLPASVPLRQYELSLARGQSVVTLHYAGRISHPLTTHPQDGGRAQQTTPGLIGPQGAYLDGDSHWYARFGAELVDFTLEVEMPSNWRSISQGQHRGHGASSDKHIDRWQARQPQEEIYLVAGHYREFHQRTPWADAWVLLHKDERELARRYLRATGRYLDLYSRLLGPYPYSKFALVENFWETGYGMPSFTLLGPRVIRLPFIIDSSLPHEIVHNWWGNGVYLDRAGGNWAEGLTSYLADHLIQEQQGLGADYRRSALQKYADYVASERDFPLTAFKGRRGEVSQAVGYGKTLMLFHMLRLRLGDEVFIRGLRRFYRENRFRRAGFKDIKAAFETVSDVGLDAMFSQWIERTGAPALTIDDINTERDGKGYRLRGVLRQVQPGDPYHLRLPVAVQLKDTKSAFQTTVEMRSKQVPLDLRLPATPLRLQVDPEFDLFRRLDPAELPPSLGQLFGAARLMIVLPAAATRPLREGYQRIARTWTSSTQDVQLRWDNELRELPSDRAVWLFGWENRFRRQMAGLLAEQGVELTDLGARVDDQTIQRKAHSLVLTGRRNTGLAWLGSDNPAAHPGLARKLPHYGKYSYLAFSGDAPENFVKGQWTVISSPLIVDLMPSADSKTPIKLAPRPALTDSVKTPR